MNPYRGEVELVINGQAYNLKLTLGALVELEQALGTVSLPDLAARFETGQPAFKDIASVLAAGLKGGQVPISASELMQAEIEGGAIVAARTAGQLLARAFNLPGRGLP